MIISTQFFLHFDFCDFLNSVLETQIGCHDLRTLFPKKYFWSLLDYLRSKRMNPLRNQDTNVRQLIFHAILIFDLTRSNVKKNSRVFERGISFFISLREYIQ